MAKIQIKDGKLLKFYLDRRVDHIKDDLMSKIINHAKNKIENDTKTPVKAIRTSNNGNIIINNIKNEEEFVKKSKVFKNVHNNISNALDSNKNVLKFIDKLR